MKSSIRSLLHVLAISLILLLAPRLMAMILPPPLPPASTPPVGIVIDEPTPQTAVRTTATISFADATQVCAHSIDGRFRLVGMHLNEVVTVVVQFPAGWATALLAIQALDGGHVFPQTAQTVIAAGGITSFQFQAGNQPGLYRISMIGAGGSSTLNFWVADPANSQANRPVANPSH